MKEERKSQKSERTKKERRGGKKVKTKRIWKTEAEKQEEKTREKRV